MNSTNRKVLAWQPMLSVGLLSLLLLVTLSPCRDLFAAGLTYEQTEVSSASRNNGREIVGVATSQGGLPNCCHWMVTRHDTIQAAPVVVDYRSPQPDGVTLVALAWDQGSVEVGRNWRQTYHAPTSSLPLYLRFKQLLI